MAQHNRGALQRILPLRDLFRGRPLIALVLSACGTLAICAALLASRALLDGFVTRGELDAPPSLGVLAVFGYGTAEAPDAEGDAAPVPVPRPEWLDVGGDRGLVPTAVRWIVKRDVWAGPLASAVRGVPALRANTTMLLVVLPAILLFAAAAWWLVHLARVQAQSQARVEASRLRRSIHRHSLRLGPEDLRDQRGAVVLRLFTEDVENVRHAVVASVLRLGRDPLRLAVLFLFALSLAPLLALQCLVPLAGCWYLIHAVRNRRREHRAAERDRARRDLDTLAESLRKTRLVRGFGMENFEHEQFRHHLERYERDTRIVERRDDRANGWLGLIVGVCLALVVFLVGLKVLTEPGEVSFATAVTLLATFAVAYPSMESLAGLPRLRQRGATSAEAIQEFLDVLPEVSQAVGAKFLEPLSRELRFESVSYKLPDGRPLLRELDLTVRAGDSVALVSHDPLETRAIAYMLPRFVEPAGGRVLIDGEDIAWVTLESLRAETIFVGGEDPFFTGTVFQNISCGAPEYNFTSVVEAAKTAHAHNFVQKLPERYETLLGEHGERLDPGQGFRLGLARAALRDPALLIVAEPDAPLDNDTKALLDDAYDRILPGRTVLLLPTRLSTLRRADRIVVVHGGRVVADGRYADLVKNSPEYRHWEYARFNEFQRAAEPQPVPVG